MIKAVHVGLALAFAVLSACAAEKSQESPISIKGQLISETTKKPLAGYLVEVGDARPRSSVFGIPGPVKFGSGKSDANGRFTVTIADSTAYLKAEKGGQIALYLSGIGTAAGREPIVGSIGRKEGKSPVYMVPSLLGISSPSWQ